MDITVKAAGDQSTWQLIDLLGRSMGAITRSQSEFTIVPAGHALQTMKGTNLSPFPSLDAALADIEKHTRGTCRLDGPHTERVAIRIDKLNVMNDE